MKIAKIDARCLSVPIKFPFTETPSKEGMLLVQVETDDGLVGHGISRDTERFAVRELINRDIGPFLIGKAPLDTEKIWPAHLPAFGRRFSRFGCRLHHLRVQRL